MVHNTANNTHLNCNYSDVIIVNNSATITIYLNIWHPYFNRYLYNYFNNFHILGTLPVYGYTENKVNGWTNPVHGQSRYTNFVEWKLSTGLILQHDGAMGTHWTWCSLYAEKLRHETVVMACRVNFISKC